MKPGTPKSLRLHIGFFGRRNVGKSSLLNALTRQQVSIVSHIAGTTTDPVEKPMELLPLGPVLFIDTAGIDDEGYLGELRVEKTRQALDRTDLGVLVADAAAWGRFEDELLAELRLRKIPVVVVFNKTDREQPPAEMLNRLVSEKVPVVKASAVSGAGISDLREALLNAAPPDFLNNRGLLADLVGPGDLAILVIPIDKEAPKGRLILPQVQAIRDLLDGDSSCLVVKENGLRDALARLKTPPKLVVTDSQAFAQVAADTPRSIPLTGFSILLSRLKGDLNMQVRGAMAIGRLRPGDRVLIAEACTHHPIGEDIGRVKIPKWLSERAGGKIEFDTVQGHDFPSDLSPYKLVIQCGACMWNRREVLSRLLRCQQAGVPMTNYGLAIAYTVGIFERALEPFPAALEMWRKEQAQPRGPVAIEQDKGFTPGSGADEGKAARSAQGAKLSREEIRAWLREENPERLEKLWRLADETRLAHVGGQVHLRGLVEVSNHCARRCAYCGLWSGNRELVRYRMEKSEVLAAARNAVRLGFGTVVLQAGEDRGLTVDWVGDLVRQIKAETPLAVTLSLGERAEEELAAWRAAGADRYLLRFETSDRALFETVHPGVAGRPADRVALLRRLKELGYETGSGIMVGLPGQTWESVVRDIRLFRELDLDMIGVGPFIPHPATPLGSGRLRPPHVNGEQVPNSEIMVYKVMALTRLVCPDANIPSTTALATINKQNGRELGLQRGANVIMPNLTPLKYRRLYEIYPNKACVGDTGEVCSACLGARIASIGRLVGRGPGRRGAGPREASEYGLEAQTK